VSGPANAFALAAEAVNRGADALEAAATVVGQMTPEEKLWCLDGDVPFWAGLGDLGSGGYHKRPFPAACVERLGLPGFAFSDGPRGVVIGPATCFPVSMARGATWDLDLEERIGAAIGRELRAVGATLYGGVCVNILRHPAWGRAQETYGEDPVAVGEMGAALARGVQRWAMACVKHFACNSIEDSRFIVDVTVEDTPLHEIFLPHFRRVVDEGVAAVMTAYNSVNGSWCGHSRQLITEVLRGEWGFEGFVISDWIFGVRDAPASLVAGLDVEMPYRMVRASHLDEALERGDAWEEVNAAVTHVVSTLLRFDDVLGRPRPDRSVLACAEHRTLAREAATKSIVLLRNEPVGAAPLLPFDPGSLSRVAVIGRLAAVRNLGDGGSSDVWAPEVVTALDGLRAALPHAEVVHSDGDDPAEAAALAAGCDAAVVIVGYTRADEGEYMGLEDTAKLTDLLPPKDDPALAMAFTESASTDPWHQTAPVSAGDPAVSGAGEAANFTVAGDRASLRLHDRDEELIEAVSGAQPSTAVSIVAGSAVIVSPWIYKVPAVMQSWYSGMEGGHAVADVLLGRVVPSGRLPFTVPTDAAHLPPFEARTSSAFYDGWHGWWLLERDGNAPQFPFGFGLSYTSFELGAVSAVPSGTGEPGLVVRGSVHNSGGRDGADVVQVYGGPSVPAPGRRPRRLLGFARLEVPAGATAEFDIRVRPETLAIRDGGRWSTPSGTWLLDVARNACDPSTRTLQVEVDPSSW
jgi:beta-glucosidase-like glycosyl hydrolase